MLTKLRLLRRQTRLTKPDHHLLPMPRGSLADLRLVPLEPAQPGNGQVKVCVENSGFACATWMCANGSGTTEFPVQCDRASSRIVSRPATSWKCEDGRPTPRQYRCHAVQRLGVTFMALVEHQRSFLQAPAAAGACLLKEEVGCWPVCAGCCHGRWPELQGCAQHSGHVPWRPWAAWGRLRRHCNSHWTW